MYVSSLLCLSLHPSVRLSVCLLFTLLLLCFPPFCFFGFHPFVSLFSTLLFLCFFTLCRLLVVPCVSSPHTDVRHLFVAVSSSRMEVLNSTDRALLRAARNRQGGSLLVSACARGDEKIIRFLLQAGVSYRMPPGDDGRCVVDSAYVFKKLCPVVF